MKHLTIKDVKKMIGKQIDCGIHKGYYICTDVLEDETDYMFKFAQSKTAGVTGQLFLERYSDYSDKGRFLYSIKRDKNGNVIQYVSADWFTFDNAVKSFGEGL